MKTIPSDGLYCYMHTQADTHTHTERELVIYKHFDAFLYALMSLYG